MASDLPVMRDYLERTIETVRNHKGADNCWPQWANIFADEIERLWSEQAMDQQQMHELVEAADWYRRCLEDVIDDRNPVRGLAEAREAYDSAADRIRATLAGKEEAWRG